MITVSLKVLCKTNTKITVLLQKDGHIVSHDWLLLQKKKSKPLLIKNKTDYFNAVGNVFSRKHLLQNAPYNCAKLYEHTFKLL